jgi:hypothetical protein
VRTNTKEKVVNKVRCGINLLLLLPLLLLTCGPAAAVGNNYEYHADARMQHASRGTVKDAYGYVYVVTDKKGHGVIRVMFSNGTPLHHARFNASVKFLDASGTLIREEHFERRIEAAGFHGAAEHRLTRLVDLAEFASIRVEFFLSDILVVALAGL